MSSLYIFFQSRKGTFPYAFSTSEHLGATSCLWMEHIREGGDKRVTRWRDVPPSHKGWTLQGSAVVLLRNFDLLFLWAKACCALEGPRPLTNFQECLLIMLILLDHIGENVKLEVMRPGWQGEVKRSKIHRTVTAPCHILIQYLASPSKQLQLCYH